MGTIILTSNSFANENIKEKTFSLIPNKHDARVAIITTAAKDKEKDKYAILTKQQFLEADFKHVDFIDLEYDNFSSSDYNVIYVCGGNTFTLLKFAKERNFDVKIKKLLDKNGVYIGVSAGSIIMTPTIGIANEIEPDENSIELKSLKAFNFVNFHILPHYTKMIENKVKDFENKHHAKVERLADGEALFISNGLIEKVK